MQNRSRPGAVTRSTGREIARRVYGHDTADSARAVRRAASECPGRVGGYIHGARSGAGAGGICYEQGAAADVRATAVGIGAGENPSAGTGFVERGRAAGAITNDGGERVIAGVAAG